MTRHAACASAFLILLGSTPLAGQRSDRRVVDAAAMASAGWHRLGDIASALPPGSTASVDGFNHELTGSRLGFREAGGPSVMWMLRLDGQQVPAHVGGLWIFDAVPVAITQLDSVVIEHGPRIVDGRVTFLGTIDLFTRRPRTGVSAIGDYQHGDETGDPGPGRYTPGATQNVEKLGPFASGAVALATGRASLDAGARYSSLNITDTRIMTRIPNFGALQNDVNASGGSGVASLDAFGGRHYAVGGRGRFLGLMRVPTLGADQSARVITSHAGISGSSVDGQRWRYAASVTRLDVEPFRDAIPLIIEQARLITDAFVETHATGSFRVGIGTNLGEQSAGGRTSERRSDRLWIAHDRREQQATVTMERSLGGVRVSGMARRQFMRGDSDIVAIALSAINSSADRENGWMEGVGTSTTRTSSLGAADLRVELTTPELLGVRPTWYARGFGHTGMRASGDAFGIGGGLVVATAPARRAQVWARAELTQLIGDGDIAESSTPAGFVEGTASTRVPGNFAIALTARYAPSTRWPLLDADGSGEVPATRSLGLSVNKPMWHNRVRMQLVIRNVPNVEERTHPLGAQWDLRTHLALTIALP